MSNFLKGNYKLDTKETGSKKEEKETITQQFERRALERLGGSIAFVMKKGTFVWDGKTEKKSK